MTPAAGSAGTAGAGFRADAHRPYWNAVLEAAFCSGCGDNWPCLPYRQADPMCRCEGRRSQHGSDRNGRPICRHSFVCGCTTFRSEEEK